MNASDYVCARCGAALPHDPNAVDYCWWCEATLCAACHGKPGHCGHPEAEELDRRAEAMSLEERRRIADGLRRRKPS